MRLLRFFAIAVFICMIVLAGMIVFGTAKTPPVSQAILDPFRKVDFSDLPPVNRYRARDGSELAYREYQPVAPVTAPSGSDEKQVAVLLHGSPADGQSMHALAKTLAKAGITVLVPDLRGHGANQPRGDLRYVGQLDDDMADFVRQKRPQYPATRWSLIGFSSGGGIALRLDGGPNGDLFDRYLLLSPYISYDGPTQRPMPKPAAAGSGSDKKDNHVWAAPYTGRLIALLLLGKIGIHWFDGLPVMAFAVPAQAKSLTPTYSMRLLTNMGPHRDYLGDIRNIRKPTTVMIGENDEFSFPDQFAPLFHSQHADVEVKVLPQLGHVDLITNPVALTAIEEWTKNNGSAGH